MRIEELLKVYRRGEKFLVLNPLVPTWVVTNLNVVLLHSLQEEFLSAFSRTFEKFFLPA